MSGRALDAFDMVPRLLLAHLGQELEISVPTLTSLRVMTGLIKKESHKALTRAQLITFTRCWCYEHKLLIPGDRALDDFVRKATQQAEQDLLDRIKEAIPETLRQDWLLALGSNHSKDRSVLAWLQGEPGKASRATLNRQLAYIDYLKGLSVHEYPLDMLRLEHQKQLAQRIRRRRPARWQTLKEPRRTLESVAI